MNRMKSLLHNSLVYLHGIGFISGTFSIDRIFQVHEYQEGIFSPVVFQVRSIFAILFLSFLCVSLMKDRTLLSRFSVKSPILIVLLVMIVGLIIVDFLAVGSFQFEEYIPMILLFFYLSTLGLILKDRSDIHTYLYLITFTAFSAFAMSLSIGKFSLTSFQISPIGTAFTLAVLAANGAFISLWRIFQEGQSSIRRSLWFLVFFALIFLGTATGSRAFPIFLTLATLVIVLLFASRNRWLNGLNLSILVIGCLTVATLTLKSDIVVYNTDSGKIENSHRPNVYMAKKLLETNEVVSECEVALDSFVKLNKLELEVTSEKSCTTFLIVDDSDGRLRLLDFALSNIINPFGNGLGTFSFVSIDPYGNFNAYGHAHNLIVNTYYESGIIGITLMSALLLICLVEVLKLCFKCRSADIILIGIPSYIFMLTLVAGDLYDARWSFLLILILQMFYEKDVELNRK